MAAVPSDKTPLVPVSLLPELPTADEATRQALGAGNVGHAFSQLLKLQAKPCSHRVSTEPTTACLTSDSWGGPSPPHLGPLGALLKAPSASPQLLILRLHVSTDFQGLLFNTTDSLYRNIS